MRAKFFAAVRQDNEAATDAELNAKFDAWVQSLKDSGLTVESASIGAIEREKKA